MAIMTSGDVNTNTENPPGLWPLPRKDTGNTGRGSVLWEVTFKVGVLDAIIADVDGDGLAEIVVETEDGYVRVLKGPAP